MSATPICRGGAQAICLGRPSSGAGIPRQAAADGAGGRVKEGRQLVAQAQVTRCMRGQGWALDYAGEGPVQPRRDCIPDGLQWRHRKLSRWGDAI